MAERDALTALAEQLALALQPLASALSSPESLHDFLVDFGWEISPVPPAVSALKAPVEQVVALVESTGSTDDIDVVALLNGVSGVFRSISDLAGAGGLPAGFAATFPRELVDRLVVQYLLVQQPRWGQVLRVLGVLRLEEVAAAGARPPYVRRVVAYEAIGRLADDPLAVVHETYRWGQSDFRGDDLADNLYELILGWGLDVVSGAVDATMLAQLNAGALNPTDARQDLVDLVLMRNDSDEPLEVGVAMFLLPETATAKPGFALLPYGRGEVSEGLPLTDNVSIRIGGTASVTGGLGVLVRPNGVALQTGFGTGGGPTGASGTFTIALVVAEHGEPLILVGRPAASRVEIVGASLLFGTRFHSGGQFEVFVEAAVKGAKLAVQPAAGESDSFLARLLPAEGVSVGADVTVGFSSVQGLYFGGSGGLEVAIPAHLQLGPIEVLGATFAVRATDGLAVDLGASLKGDLAVLTAVVDGIGATALVTFPADRKGNLGPANLAMRFKAPKGVGLSIDAGVVKGGGFLYLDTDKGEYAGALELTFSGFLSVKAIGLINTKMPGGQPGFSLLVIITAEFSPGFQLGFGFTLSGVGGLLGLNRGMLLEPLAAGIRTGAVNNILFPTNVVENAPRIISDLRTIFPPREGVFLIGPMAKIGWGTPTLVSVSLGVIIEIPGNIAILGRLRVNLPTEDAPIVLLQITFLGALEFDKRRIWFFASLYESRLLFITLDGEMGLLMDYSDNPNFVLSVGGFHPRFTAPPLPFPAPRRLELSLINESFARVRVETYLAVTSNSVQVGARAEAFFGFDALSVEGYFSFDALVRFSPVYFIVEVSAGFSVKVFGMGVYGIHLRGSLEGPTPWHVNGSASIEFFFFSISVDVEITFGERRAEVLPPLPLLPALVAELSKLDVWRASLPTTGRLLVSLRELGDQELLVLHPVGRLSISQRVVPLGLPLDRVGNQKPSDIKKATVSVTSAGLSVVDPAKESFARAQYQDMDDAAKLSTPAFEKLESGVELGAAGSAWATGPGAQRTVRYEEIIVDTAHERRPRRFFVFWANLFTHFQRGASISRSELSLENERRHRPFADKVEVGVDQYVVANVADNTAAGAAAGTTMFASHAEASAHLIGVLAADPALAGSVHVIPAVEVNAAA